MQSDTADRLLKPIEELKLSEVRSLVDKRTREFRENAKKPSEEIFKELCFNILCANYNAERSIKIQTAIEDGFLTLPESELAEKLKALGYRFPNVRAKYIVQARRYKSSLKEVMGSFNDGEELREWLINHIKGIGPKEASHFLRNVGYTDFAILDFHVINVLAKHGLIEKPRTLTKRRYREIEELLREIARKTDLNLAELDLYLWYMETGRVLK